MLITSRETHRWVIPKGNRMLGLADHQAAAREAFEEAGVSGASAQRAIGSFTYGKRRGAKVHSTRVTVFPLLVAAQASRWPEQAQRETRWFSRAEAAGAVEEPELRALIAAFRPGEIGGDGADPPPTPRGLRAFLSRWF